MHGELGWRVLGAKARSPKGTPHSCRCPVGRRVPLDLPSGTTSPSAPSASTSLHMALVATNMASRSSHSTWPHCCLHSATINTHTPHSSTESPRIHHPLSTRSLATTKMVLTSCSVRSLPHNQYSLHLTVHEVFISHSMQSLPTTNMVLHLTLTGLHPTANSFHLTLSMWSSPQTIRNPLPIHTSSDSIKMAAITSCTP